MEYESYHDMIMKESQKNIAETVALKLLMDSNNKISLENKKEKEEYDIWHSKFLTEQEQIKKDREFLQKTRTDIENRELKVQDDEK
jgi:hypothetical protein